MECQICYQLITTNSISAQYNPTIKYRKSCLNKWLDKTNRCPHCRAYDDRGFMKRDLQGYVADMMKNYLILIIHIVRL